MISAGFKERGAEGVALERQIQEQLRRSSMRLIGPNCLGIMNPTIGECHAVLTFPPRTI